MKRFGKGIPSDPKKMQKADAQLRRYGEQSCANKWAFRERARAKKRAKELNMKVYRCAMCHGYHLTKAPNV